MKLDPQVENWIDRWALAELAESGFAQVDIDELLEPAPLLAAKAMVDCMELAVTRVHVTDVAVTGLVVLPLPYAGDQASPPTKHPTLADLLQLEWTYGPGLEVPGLYLLRPGVDLIADVEEYRIELPQHDRGHRAYYRAWRTLEERECFPQEWSRAVCVRMP